MEMESNTKGPPMTTTIDNSTDIDPEAIEAFTGFVGAQATAALNGLLVALGDHLGLWKALAGAGPLTAGQVSARTGFDERHLREWLAAQAANGFLICDPEEATFTLSNEAAMVLAHEDSPMLLAAAFQGLAPVARSLPALEAAFRTGDGVAWQDRDSELWDVQERYGRPMQHAFLVDVWLAAVPGLLERLEAGITVADVGCGYGGSTVLLAERFPESRFVGFDFHDHSIVQARNAARRAGVGGRVSFEVARADGFPGDGYDAVLFIDCLHDMGDPVAAVRHARNVLASGGVVVTLDPAAHDTLGENLADPLMATMYTVSTFLCTPTAAAQHGPMTPGAAAGEAVMRGVLRDAGFESVERVADGAPFNMILVAKD
jgi:ubiquinone/menaquinone biosynthesis C-methylase UbiE